MYVIYFEFRLKSFDVTLLNIYLSQNNCIQLVTLITQLHLYVSALRRASLKAEA